MLRVSDMSQPPLRVEAGGLLPRAKNLTGFNPPQKFLVADQFKQLMLEALAHHASDVYIQPNLPVCARINGDLMALTPSTVDDGEVMNMIKWTGNRDTAETDILSGIPVNGRYELFSPTERDTRGARLRHGYRVNISPILTTGGTSGQIVMRAIPGEPVPYHKLGLSEQLVLDCIYDSGLVYIAGATGSGKTTTFAAIIRYILEHDTAIKGNLLTHEEPIEFTYDAINSQHSILVQSEVPQHFKDFYAANREAMRRKPGLVLVGEMRDQETIAAGVELSLTGHPVFATVHATDVPSVMRRLISRFPTTERSTAIYDIVDTARMIMAQRLVKGIDGKLIAVREYLKFTDKIRDHLSELDQMGKITSEIAKIVETDGHSFRKEAHTLLAQGRITEAVAHSICPPQKEAQIEQLLAQG